MGGGPRRGVLIFGMAQAAAMACSFLGSIVLVRIAAPPVVGSYVLFLQAAAACTLVLGLGLHGAVLRFAPLARGRGGRAASAVLRRRLLAIQLGGWLALGPVIAVVWPGVAWRLDASELASAPLALIGVGMLMGLNQTADAYLRAFRAYRSSAWLGELLPRGLLMAAFLAIYWRYGPGAQTTWMHLAAIYFLVQLTVAFLYAMSLRLTSDDEQAEARDADPPPRLQGLLATSTAMALKAALTVVTAASAPWLVSWARTHEEVAVYGVALALGQVFGLMPAIMQRVVPQEFATMHAEGRLQDLERLARTSATLVTIPSAIALTVLFLVGRPLIHLVYGSPYENGWAILVILAIGSLIDAAMGSAGFILQTTGRHVALLRMTGIAALVNVGVSAMLVKPLGGLGVALGGAIGVLVLNLMMVTFVQSVYRIRSFAYAAGPQWVWAARQLVVGGFGSSGGGRP